MSSRSRSPLLTIALLSSLLGACGVMGDRADEARFLEIASSSAGCLNSSNVQVDDFLSGKVTKEAWSAPFQCAESSLALFLKYVRSSSHEGYSIEDIHALVNGILVTDEPVSVSTLSQLFKLKATLIGGSAQFVTREEAEKTLRVIRTVKDATTALIPHLRKSPPSQERARQLIKAFETAGLEVLGSLGEPGQQSLDREALVEIASFAFRYVKLELTAPQLVELLLAAKALLLAGDPNLIEGASTHELLRTLSPLLGVVQAAIEISESSLKPDRVSLALLTLAQSTVHPLQNAINKHGGALPLERIDRIVDGVPETWLRLRKSTLKGVMRVLSDRVLRSSAPGTLGSSALERLLESMSQWSKSAHHLNQLAMLTDLPASGFELEKFEDMTLRYSQTVGAEDRPSLQRVISLARDFHPMYPPDSHAIDFSSDLKLSHAQLSQLNWITLASDLLISAYASPAASPSLTKADLGGLFTDLHDLVKELEMLDPDIPQLHERRFREGDLFTLGSDGDGRLNRNELSYLIAYLLSIGERAMLVRSDVEPVCTESSGLDPIGWDWMEAECFRTQYFTRVPEYWLYAPGLLEHFLSLPEGLRKQLETHMENGARLQGRSDLPIGSYDTQSFVGVVHYVESLYVRFDADRDGILNVPELLEAFPVFQHTIAEVGKLDPGDRDLLEAVFTYIVAKGKPPADNLLGKADLLRWKLSKKSWKISATRSDVYKVVSFFNSFE